MKPVIRLDRRIDMSNSAHRARIVDELAATQQMFVKADGSIWIVIPPYPPYRADLTIEHMGAAMQDVADFTRPGREEGQPDVPVSPPRDLVAQVMLCGERRRLPRLTQVVLDPAVYFVDGKPHITQPGYDPITGIYYVCSGEPPIPSSSTEHLTTLLSGVPFEAPEDRNTVIAWLLGAVVLDPSMESPLLVVTGNTAGVGKSKTVEALGYILTGQTQAPIDQGSEEFTKQVGARFNEGGRFIAIDNVVARDGSYKNRQLCQFLTSGWSKACRVLGSSRTVSQAGVLFCLTANDCKLEHDLAVRSLPIRLFRSHLQPMVPFVVDYAKTHRRAIYEELLGLATSAVFAEYPDAPGFRFRTWYEFVAPRITAAFGAMTINEAISLDDTVLEIASWGLDMNEGASFTSEDLIKAITAEPARFPACADAILSKTSDRMKKRAAAFALSRLIDKPVSPGKGVTVLLRLLKAAANRQLKTFAWEKEVVDVDSI